jgi:hypothetical protein
LKNLNLGQAIQVLANVGVLAGIIFLAVEVRQNQASMEEDRNLNALVVFSDFREVVSQSEQLSKIWVDGLSGEELAPVEMLRFNFLCANYLWAYWSNYQRFESQNNNAAIRGSINSLRRQLADSTGLRECWAGMKPTVIDFGFTAFVDAVESGS